LNLWSQVLEYITKSAEYREIFADGLLVLQYILNTHNDKWANNQKQEKHVRPEIGPD